MTMPTLLDIAKRNGSDAATGLIEEASRAHPELTLVPARPIAGQNYKTLVRTSVPHGSGFRAANAGVVAGKSGYENRLVETFIFNPRWECDPAVADRAEDGRAAYVADEGLGILEGAMQDLCGQFYYGTNATLGNATGFPGLVQAYDATNMAVDATGSTPATGSSVWLIRRGPKMIRWVWGANGQLQLSDVRTESITPDPTNAPTARFSVYVQELLAYPGLQVGSLFAAARIKKLTADSGHTLTDDMIAAAIALFPAGIAPDLILMNRRSRGQLQNSRTAVNATGAPAPMPTDAFGIPIEVTDAISSIEDLAL